MLLQQRVGRAPVGSQSSLGAVGRAPKGTGAERLRGEVGGVCIQTLGLTVTGGKRGTWEI